jgi:excisionase family DNA binding protein
MNSPKVLSVREAAQRLGCTLKYVYDLLYSGRLPAQKRGQQWRIPAEAVETRLRQRGV